MKRVGLWSLMACGVLSSRSASAHPGDQFGMGARAVGMSGAATGTARGFAASYYNPALLAHSDALTIELGYGLSLPRLEINDALVDVDASHGFQGGVSAGGEVLGHRVGFSLALMLPDELISRVRTRRESQPRFVLFDNLPQRLVVSTSLGVEILEGLFVGAGLTYIASTAGKLDVRGVVSATREDLTRLASAVDVTFSSVRTPVIGLAYEKGPIHVGLSYREEFFLELDLDVEVRGQITLTDEELVLVENGAFILDSYNTDLFSPRQLTFGMAYEGDGWLLSFDLTWANYSAFPAPVSRIDLDLDLGDLQFEVPIPAPPQPPGFVDVLTPRLGIEMDLWSQATTRGVIRAGYAFIPSPVPAQSGATNYIDANKHLLSLGFGVSTSWLDVVLPKPLEVDLAVSAEVMERVDVEKERAADPIGDYRAGGIVWTSVLGTRWAF